MDDPLRPPLMVRPNADRRCGQKMLSDGGNPRHNIANEKKGSKELTQCVNFEELRRVLLLRWSL